MMHITYEVYVKGSRFRVERQLCWRHLGYLFNAISAGKTHPDGSPMYGAWIVWGKPGVECDACREEAANAVWHPMECEK